MLTDVKTHVDPANDSVELILDLVGNDPFQHEFLKEVFASELSEAYDEKVGQPDAAPHAKALGEEDLRIRLPFRTAGAFQRASHTIENRRRASLNLPSLEQEAEANAAKAQASSDAEKSAAELEAADKVAKLAGFPSAAAKKEHDDLIALEELKGEAFARGQAKVNAPKPAAPVVQ
jgi:hypothetical protein